MPKIKGSSSWWHGRTTSELWILLAFIFNTFGQIGSNRTSPGYRNAQEGDTSDSDYHWYIAPMILGKMNEKVKACNDFYQFACGNFVKKTRISKSKNYVSTTTTISDLYKKQLAEIVKEERSETDHKYLKLPNKLFKGCMDTTLIDNLGYQPIQEISESLGGWPVVVGDSWDRNNTWTWQGLTKKLRRVGSTTPYLFSILVQPYNSSHIIELGPPRLAYGMNFLNNFAEKYFNHMVEIAKLFGVRKAVSKTELSRALLFGMELARISEPADPNVPEIYNLLSIKQLQEIYPYAEWLDLINAMLPAQLKVDENEEIKLLVPGFFQKLGLLLERYIKREIANYMMWKFYEAIWMPMPTEFRRRVRLFNAAIRGERIMEDRLINCVNFVIKYLEMPVSSLYVSKHLKYDTKRTVLKMFENIREAFNQTLDETQWLDNEAKKEAKRKLYSIKPLVGFSDEIWDHEKLDKSLKGLEIDPSKFLQSYLNTITYLMDYTFGILRLPAADGDWHRYIPITETAIYYYHQRNIIRIPAAALQTHLFQNQFPISMNYGGIGSIIGHEISHAFFGTGRFFDADRKHVDWWKQNTERAYQEKADCLIEQYDNYVEKQTGLKINGTRTLVENIADHGVKQAYMAFSQNMSREVCEERLPGLVYTPRQIFWISYAQIWCSKSTSDVAEQKVKYDEHSPNESRVLGVLRNMKDFALDFHCPDNSFMNPLQKCEVF